MVAAYADAGCDPMDFPTAATLAVPKALEAAGLNKEDIDLWEINEAFSVVGVAAEKILGLDHEKVNIPWWCRRTWSRESSILQM